ncbi:MAG: hypothetical protein SFY69_02155 [Planctomycetota bacterium]|nr:hypothetical protein [Planctomycetota bacterium]
MNTSAARVARAAGMVFALGVGMLGAGGCQPSRWVVVVENQSARPVNAWYSMEEPAAAVIGPGSQVGLESRRPFEATLGRWDDGKVEYGAKVESVRGGPSMEPSVVAFDEDGRLRWRVRTGADEWRVLDVPRSYEHLQTVRPFMP